MIENGNTVDVSENKESQIKDIQELLKKINELIESKHLDNIGAVIDNTGALVLSDASTEEELTFDKDCELDAIYEFVKFLSSDDKADVENNNFSFNQNFASFDWAKVLGNEIGAAFEKIGIKSDNKKYKAAARAYFKTALTELKTSILIYANDVKYLYRFAGKITKDIDKQGEIVENGDKTNNQYMLNNDIKGTLKKLNTNLRKLSEWIDIGLDYGGGVVSSKLRADAQRIVALRQKMLTQQSEEFKEDNKEEKPKSSKNMTKEQLLNAFSVKHKKCTKLVNFDDNDEDEDDEEISDNEIKNLKTQVEKGQKLSKDVLSYLITVSRLSASLKLLLKESSSYNQYMTSAIELLENSGSSRAKRRISKLHKKVKLYLDKINENVTDLSSTINIPKTIYNNAVEAEKKLRKAYDKKLVKDILNDIKKNADIDTDDSSYDKAIKILNEYRETKWPKPVIEIVKEYLNIAKDDNNNGKFNEEEFKKNLKDALISKSDTIKKSGRAGEFAKFITKKMLESINGKQKGAEDEKDFEFSEKDVLTAYNKAKAKLLNFDLTKVNDKGGNGVVLQDKYGSQYDSNTGKRIWTSKDGYENITEDDIEKATAENDEKAEDEISDDFSLDDESNDDFSLDDEGNDDDNDDSASDDGNNDFSLDDKESEEGEEEEGEDDDFSLDGYSDEGDDSSLDNEDDDESGDFSLDSDEENDFGLGDEDDDFSLDDEESDEDDSEDDDFSLDDNDFSLDDEGGDEEKPDNSSEDTKEIAKMALDKLSNLSNQLIDIIKTK